MTRLLDDLLEVSRITQGKIELRKQLIDARQVVSEALVALRERFANRGIEVSVSLSSAPIWVEADPARLQQIVVNLLDNAAKYTAAKFPVVTEGTPVSSGAGVPPSSSDDGLIRKPSGGQTTLELTVADGDAVLTVTDNGVGIDSDMLDIVFEPFVQGATTIHRTEGGMGVGLSVVRSLVHMHDGTIKAFSDGRGQGSRFVVRLPLAPVSSSTACPALAATPPGLRASAWW